MTSLSLPLGQITFYKSIFNSVRSRKNFINHISLFPYLSTQFFASSPLTTTFLWLMNTSSIYDNRVDGIGASK